MASRDPQRLTNQVQRALDAIADPIEREILRNYKTALDEIRSQLARVYERYAKNGVLTNAEMSKYNRLTSLHKQLTGTLGPTLSKNGTLVQKLAEIEYEEAFYHYAWALDQQIGVELAWGLVNEKTIDAAINSQSWKILRDIADQDLRRQVLARIRRAVSQGIIQGQSYEEMARAFKDILDKGASRALTIARTEGGRAQTLGQLRSIEEAEEMGVDLKRYWDATLDNRTRFSHGALDGVAAGEDGMFDTEVGPVQGPRLSGVPEFDINCRCSVTARVDDIPPKYRRIRDEGVVPYKTYEEWRMEHGG